MKKICEYCGKEFEAHKNTTKYCSRYCTNKVYCATEKYKKIKANRNKSLDYKLKTRYRSAIRSAMLGHVCTSSCWNVLPYTYLEVRANIESKFTNGMTWDNYGKVWHVDHIIPLAYYDYVKDGGENEEVIREANKLSNLRPLLVKDNLKKSSFFLGKRYLHEYKNLT